VSIDRRARLARGVRSSALADTGMNSTPARLQTSDTDQKLNAWSGAEKHDHRPAARVRIIRRSSAVETAPPDVRVRTRVF
jgi:hypothetical protein